MSLYQAEMKTIKEKVKSLMIDEIKRNLEYYEETVDSVNADRLYFLKQHTLVSELYFNEENETYSVKGYKNDKGRKIWKK